VIRQKKPVKYVIIILLFDNAQHSTGISFSVNLKHKSTWRIKI